MPAKVKVDIASAKLSIQIEGSKLDKETIAMIMVANAPRDTKIYRYHQRNPEIFVFSEISCWISSRVRTLVMSPLN